VLDVYAASHGQVMNNLMGHQLHVLLRFSNHQLHIGLLNLLDIAEGLVVLVDASDQQSHFSLCPGLQKLLTCHVSSVLI